MAATTGVAFAKLEGLGNDFMLIEATADDALPDADQIIRWAHRRTGIGFDQMLVLLPEDGNALRVRIFNADGSEAEQCGNGMRAIAAWLDKHRRLTPEFRLHTPAGPVTLSASDDGRYQADLPGARPLRASELELPDPCLPQQALSWRLISLGNPHLVVAWPKPPTESDLLQAAAGLEQAPGWRNRVNLGLAYREDPGTIQLRVYERGAGPTPACGSGACAAAFAAAEPDRGHQTMEVRQPGGSVVIDLESIPGRVRTIGPARVVYQGTTE